MHILSNNGDISIHIVNSPSAGASSNAPGHETPELETVLQVTAVDLTLTIFQIHAILCTVEIGDFAFQIGWTTKRACYFLELVKHVFFLFRFRFAYNYKIVVQCKKNKRYKGETAMRYTHGEEQ
jgi:hypothetical protein